VTTAAAARSVDCCAAAASSFAELCVVQAVHRVHGVSVTQAQRNYAASLKLGVI
jgi:hypothetical protein